MDKTNKTIKKLRLGMKIFCWFLVVLSAIYYSIEQCKYHEEDWDGINTTNLTRSEKNNRSSLWRRSRMEHLRIEPQCAGCGEDKIDNLRVHHILLVNDHRELELEQTNLITLCKNCHFNIGHFGGTWMKGWPDVRNELGGITNSIGYKIRMFREKEHP